MKYQIQTSTDNVNGTSLNNVTGNTTTGLLQYPYATPFTARYVRMYGTARATGWGYSLYEFSVYGQ
jgi:beta-glucosidase